MKAGICTEKVRTKTVVGTKTAIGILAILGVAALMTGCEGEEKKHPAGHDPVDHSAHVHPAASPEVPATTPSGQTATSTIQEAPSLGLVLNGMDKWQTDNHTREMVAKMNTRLSQKVLADYSGEELKAIGTGLRKDIDELITGCTMEGDAHNELHKFLMALTAAADSLASSGDVASAEKVRELLGEYQGFFE